MNVFVVDTNPVIAAQSLCDAHVVKMIVESAQIMSTVLAHQKAEVVHDARQWDLTPDGKIHAYRPTHANHPCVVWARDPDAYGWLHLHALALCDEFTLRYGKVHRTEYILKQLPTSLTNLPKTWAITMPIEFKKSNVVDSYRAFYVGDKARFAKWTKRLPPSWFVKSEL